MWAAIAVALALSALAVAQLAAAILDRRTYFLTAEPQAALNGPWYAGSISTLGGVAWFAGATSCLLAWLVIRKRPLLLGGLLLALVGGDDLFLLHEGLYRKAFSERWVFATYLALFVAYAVVYRAMLRRFDGVRLLGLGIALLVISALVDRYWPGHRLIEDGAKLLAIATIVALFGAMAFAHLREAAAGAH